MSASLEVKNVRHLHRATLKFATVFTNTNSPRATTILDHIKPANFQTIRSTRIKLDTVAYNLFRQLWKRLIDDRICIYMYLDSSPQLRAEELFAVSFELHDPSGKLLWERRLTPLITLQRDFFDACGKALALIVLIFLLIKPAVESIVRFCGCVRSITTNIKTEHKLTRFPCIITNFYELMLGVTVAVPNKLYVPIALNIPG